MFGLTSTEQLSAEQLESLISNVGKGDKDSLSEIYGLTNRAIYGFTLSIVKNLHDAEDILQEVYIKVWNSAPGYKSMAKPMAWMFTIARNLCLTRLRQKPTHDIAEYDAYEDNRLTQDDKMLVQALLAKLSVEERQIVMLHSMSGLKHREIAEVMGINASTVLSKYSRAIKKLRKILEEDMT